MFPSPQLPRSCQIFFQMGRKFVGYSAVLQHIVIILVFFLYHLGSRCKTDSADILEMDEAIYRIDSPKRKIYLVAYHCDNICCKKITCEKTIGLHVWGLIVTCGIVGGRCNVM